MAEDMGVDRARLDEVGYGHMLIRAVHDFHGPWSVGHGWDTGSAVDAGFEAARAHRQGRMSTAGLFDASLEGANQGLIR